MTWENEDWSPHDGYWAGFIDGEGCIRWANGPRLEVTNTFKPALTRLSHKFGGSVRLMQPATARTRTVFRWTVDGWHALECVKLLRPYLFEKAGQAETLIQLGRTRPRSERRLVLLNRLREMKKQDYA
jgi:hypothetical protein